MADHSHECRQCGGDFLSCSVPNEECLSKGSPDFNGLCEECEEQERR